MSSTGKILAFAVTAGPVAFCAWLASSRTVFVVGLLGAFLGGVCLAASVTAEYGPDATARDHILGDMFSTLQGTFPGALTGMAIVWIAFRWADAENRRIEHQRSKRRVQRRIARM